MALQTQIRLQQISGSLGGSASDHVVAVTSSNLKGSGTALASVTAASLQQILQEYGNAIGRISGVADFTNAQARTIVVSDGEDIDLILDQNDAGQKIHLDSEGAVDIDAVTGVDINVATGGSDARDLSISSTGGGDSSVLISSAGTGADAMSLDVSAGSMVIAPSLADQKTLSIGPAASTQLVLSPHDTPASEKISLVNKSGTADDAIKIDAEAGGLTLAAGNDSLHIDADGTDADALNIDSAGGMDVDVDGVLDMAIGSTAAIVSTGKMSLSGSAVDFMATGGAMMLTGSAAGTFKFTGAATVQSTTGNVVIDSDAPAGKIHLDGESSTDGSASGGAIHLDAASGGISLVYNDAKSLWAEGGDMVFVANENPSGSPQPVIKLHADAGANQQIQLLNDEGTSSSAIDLTATLGGFSVDGVQASNITVASAGDADDLTISVTGANDASLLLSSAGTGADAMSLDVSAGSMVVAPSLADGQTLKLGKNGAVEMTFTPHGTAGNEKWSLVNTSGTADDAIALTATAGGITNTSGGTFDVNATGITTIDSDAALNLSGSVIHLQSDSSSSGAAGVVLESKSASGIVFRAADYTNVTYNNGSADVDGIRLAASTDFATFVAKDLFSADTTIIEAINLLHDASEPSLFVSSVSADTAADTALSALSLTSGTSGATFDENTERHKLRVFHNGLLMDHRMGTDSNGDVSITDEKILTFRFDLKAGDSIQVIRM